MKERNLFQELIYAPGPAHHRNGPVESAAAIKFNNFFKNSKFFVLLPCIFYFLPISTDSVLSTFLDTAFAGDNINSFHRIRGWSHFSFKSVQKPSFTICFH